MCNFSLKSQADKKGIKRFSVFVKRYSVLQRDLLARPEKPASTPIGGRLRELRRLLGDPERDQVAATLGVSKSTLASYERGESEPTASVLAAYNQRYGANVLWIVAGIGDAFESSGENLQRSSDLQSKLMRKLARLAERVHQEAGIRMRPEDIAAEATELYNDLRKRVDDLTDDEEIEAALPQLEVRLKKRLQQAASEPGTGKRSA